MRATSSLRWIIIILVMVIHFIHLIRAVFFISQERHQLFHHFYIPSVCSRLRGSTLQATRRMLHKTTASSSSLQGTISSLLKKCVKRDVFKDTVFLQNWPSFSNDRGICIYVPNTIFKIAARVSGCSKCSAMRKNEILLTMFHQFYTIILDVNVTFHDLWSEKRPEHLKNCY